MDSLRYDCGVSIEESYVNIIGAVDLSIYHEGTVVGLWLVD